ncbi:hypothetical protein KFD70_10435 [Bacillus pfraonensis]|uniref:hypothetical protein n=1 Tax=Bacillus TaxID=1386 RepID=UPI002A4E4B1E|nr:hypothetical protein [Bacillus pseudomycoides]
MGEHLIDSIGNFLHISYTDSERKRDNYDKLHGYLQAKEGKLRTLIEQAESAKRSYEGSSHGLPQDKIPAREFEAARHKKDSELTETINYFRQMLGDVTSAKNKAYYKWEEYKSKADAENKAEAEAAANALKNLFGK